MQIRSMVLSAALLATVGAVSAQAQALNPKPTLGVIAGLNLAKVGGSDVSDVSNRTGLAAGLYATFHMHKGFGIEPEALFSMQGAKSGTQTVKLNYIQVPVLARYDFPSKSPAMPFLVAGPAFGFKAGCKVSDGSESASCSDAGMDTKSFDLGAAVGAGVGFRAGKNTVSVQARYTHGFSDIVDGASVKNRDIGILAGISF
jgi:hypothetical protein